MRSALLVDDSLLEVSGPGDGVTSDQAAAFLRRMALAAVPVVPLHPPWTPRALLAALRSVQADSGWLICREADAVAPAATAGLAGVVLIGCPAPADDHGIVAVTACDLADAPRVMVPRNGGCWHDHRQA